MTSIEIRTNVITDSTLWQRVTCDYDYQHRRVRKQVYRWNPGASQYLLSSSLRFLYDGWNLIGQVDEVTGMRMSFLWGADLSGSLQGAGGVGGLKAIVVHNGSLAGAYFCQYDANGNVLALVHADTEQEAARYEYGPFGELIRATGTMAALNPFRFSTKYQDDETGLNYYGYRYYNASTGRWLRRDPIGERGGLNLYGFVHNRPISRFDPFGLEEQGPQVFRAICQMAKRLQGEINKLPQSSLKRPFLETQHCILDRLCNSHCCLNSSSATWLNNTVFDALGGNGNQRWKDTLALLDRWQDAVDGFSGVLDDTGGAGETGGAAIGDALMDWITTLEAAREMALTHIDQDLRKALERNGAGLNSDWKCVDDQVSAFEKKFFNRFERSGSWFFGIFSDTFDVSKFRDRMRGEVQNPIPPEPPVWDGVWPPYGIN